MNMPDGPAEMLPAFQKNNVPIVIACSKYYAPYAGVFIQSLIEHTSPEQNYDIIVMERELTDEQKKLLLSLAEGRENCSIRFCDPSNFLTDLPEEDPRFPHEVYWRVCAPHFFTQYKKIISMGIDLILKKDIAALFSIDIGNACVGAVRDIEGQGAYIGDSIARPSVSNIKMREYIDHILKLKDPFHYVNADVIVFNAEKYRKKYSLEEITRLIKRKDILGLDQDVLNILAEDELAFLPQEWNLMIPLNAHQCQDHARAPESLKIAYKQASLSPAVLHWSARPKPWVCPDVPYGNEWWEVAKRTPFMGHILSRMFDALQTRREYYKNKYGQDAAVWDPVPAVDRSRRKP